MFRLFRSAVVLPLLAMRTINGGLRYVERNAFYVATNLAIAFLMLYAFAIIAQPVAHVLMATVAFAQDGTVPPTEGGVLDLMPTIETVLKFIAAVLGAIGIWLFRLVANLVSAKTGITILGQEDIYRQYLDKAINYGIKFAISELKEVSWTKIETRNQLVSLAVGYILQFVPGALAKFGIKDENALRDLVLARLLPYDKDPGNWTGAPLPVPVPAT